MLNSENISRMLLVADDYKADVLRDSCKEFVTHSFAESRDSETFRQEVRRTPELALHLLDSLPERRNKRRRFEVESDGAASSSETVQQVGPAASASASTVSGTAAAVGSSYALNLPSTVLQEPQGLPF